MERYFRNRLYHDYTDAEQVYRQAIDYYAMAQSFNPDNDELNFKLGHCYLYSNYKLKAIPLLEKAFSLNSQVDPRIHYDLGRAYHLNMEWDRAIKEYLVFQKTLAIEESVSLRMLSGK